MKLGGVGPARLEGLSDNLSISRKPSGFPWWRVSFRSIGLISLAFLAGCALQHVINRLAP